MFYPHIATLCSFCSAQNCPFWPWSRNSILGGKFRLSVGNSFTQVNLRFSMHKCTLLATSYIPVPGLIGITGKIKCQNHIIFQRHQILKMVPEVFQLKTVLPSSFCTGSLNNELNYGVRHKRYLKSRLCFRILTFLF